MTKKLLKILGLTFILIPLIYFYYLFSIAENIRVPLDQTPNMLIQLVVAGVVGGLYAYYTQHLNKNKKIAELKKDKWTLGILFLFPIFMPIYWIRFIWPEF
jgi:hypothetical protein